jgi:cation transport regulator ChaB
MKKYDYKIQQVDANLAKQREEFTQYNQDYRKRLEDAYEERKAVDTACAEMTKKTKENNRKVWKT